jgi:hypothetical protein
MEAWTVFVSVTKARFRIATQPMLHCCPAPVLRGPQLPALTTLGLDRCFARDLTPLSDAMKLESLHLSYDCWAIMGVTFPSKLPAIKKLRLMAALQVCTTTPSMSAVMLGGCSMTCKSGLGNASSGTVQCIAARTGTIYPA